MRKRQQKRQQFEPWSEEWWAEVHAKGEARRREERRIREHKARVRVASRRWWGYGYQCRVCGADNAEIHHFDYDADYTLAKNVDFLCRTHHLAAHGGDFRYG